ncbi:MAG TPA: prepilin-type N-terminal cleavage/methylation domain-containing protein [Sumerlaeia bacterium]|nr:prepilin-type N-terminal cleavage/methylation domain-containing protein [Sumerlaeia bacterium]
MMTSREKTWLSPERAFTLIELLIVVAIIAILAAIAVPNFLEAQVRSKVSRTYADMRAVRTALESYRVDNNDYIIDADTPEWRSAEIRTWVQLTTPIAYLTFIPLAPFPYKDLGRTQVDRYGRTVFDYWGPGWYDANASLNDFAKSLGIRCIYGTAGPAQTHDHQITTIEEHLALDQGRLPVYNPTNGARSHGMILGSNKVSIY